MSTTDSAIDLLFDHHHTPCSRTPSTNSNLSSSFSDLQITRLDFAKKLGYTEEQVARAVIKLGDNVGQNELLSELIALDGGGGALTGGVVVVVGGGVGAAGGGGEEEEQLRHVIVDGSNVAMTAGNNTSFSIQGIKDCVDYFISRGHPLTLFLPSFHRHSTPDPDAILSKLESSGHLVYTPSRTDPQNLIKRTICYDDRFILKLAVETDGVVVSNDGYRDFLMSGGGGGGVGEQLGQGQGQGGGSEFRRVVEERVLMYTFVRGRFTPPDDPLGRSGPSLHQFLRKTRSPTAPPCPYGRKCTYGSKCKYYHSFTQKSVSETLRKQAIKTRSVPLSSGSGSGSGASGGENNKVLMTRTRSLVVGKKQGEGEGQGEEPVLRGHRKLERMLSINPFAGGGGGGGGSGFRELPDFPGDSSLNRVWGRSDVPSGGVVGGGGPVDEGESDKKQPPPPTMTRPKLRYHLSQLFPEAQVDHVLSLHPDSTDASFICTEIVRIFK